MQEEESRKEIMEQILSGGFTDCTIKIENNKSKISHGRSLYIYFSNGEHLTLRLDQGVGYWSRVQGKIIYPFDGNVNDQISWIKNVGLNSFIRNDKDTPTYIF